VSHDSQPFFYLQGETIRLGTRPAGRARPHSAGVIRTRINSCAPLIILSAAKDLGCEREKPHIRGPDPSASSQDDKVRNAHEFLRIRITEGRPKRVADFVAGICGHAFPELYLRTFRTQGQSWNRTITDGVWDRGVGDNGTCGTPSGVRAAETTVCAGPWCGNTILHRLPWEGGPTGEDQPWNERERGCLCCLW